jgi:hypothetical protein
MKVHTTETHLKPKVINPVEYDRIGANERDVRKRIRHGSATMPLSQTNVNKNENRIRAKEAP